MRVHYLQHVHFEGLGSIESFLKNKGYEITSTCLFKGEDFPSLDNFDWLIIMGGPMSVNDEDLYPWLVQEKEFIKKAIESGKLVLGICLGAQLIANVLGAKVYQNKYKEIGWFNINLKNLENTIFEKILPNELEVFHWHGETFDIPQNAVLIAESLACRNQAFIFKDRVFGLQFHLETTIDSAKAIIKNSRNEMSFSKYVQSEQEIFSNQDKFEKINTVMNSILECMSKNFIEKMR
jgi:GMP synthase-like glutamine amidotransferase